jgi:phage terminase small subunit
MARLTNKQAAFVDEYMIDHNATNAVRRMGNTGDRPNALGWKYLNQPAVKEEIQARMREIAVKKGISAEKVLDEICKIAFMHLDDLRDDKPKLKLVTDKLNALNLLAKHLGLYEKDNKRILEGDLTIADLIKKVTQ